VAGLVVEGALAGVVLELGVVLEPEVGLEPEQAVAALPELALARPQGQVLARVREPQSVLDLMHP
jgi:hypothetical protein